MGLKGYRLLWVNLIQRAEPHHGEVRLLLHRQHHLRGILDVALQVEF
jgi:hypothetical protein